MIKTLFSIDAFVTDVKKWKKKKIAMTKYINNLKFYRRKPTSFETTRKVLLEQIDMFGESNQNLTDTLLDIFQDEFHLFGSECGFKSINIRDSWVVRYKKHDHQITHHHGRVMYSGIIYLNLDEKQESTTFIAPWPSEVTGQTKLTQLQCKEGTLAIFPAHLLHFAKPNTIDKDRVVISFDMDCNV
tara:strand:- start:558 stop:1115 length:558 start_codon:yes stop_codon:yes gene_type:complete